MPVKVQTDVLLEVMANLLDGTREELTAVYNRKVRRSQRVHASSVYRALRRLGYVSKKKYGGQRSRNVRT
jgi:transposase